MTLGLLVVVLLSLVAASLALSSAQAWAISSPSSGLRHLIVWAVPTLAIGSRYIGTLTAFQATTDEMMGGALVFVFAPASVFASALAVGAWRARAKALSTRPFGKRILALVAVHFVVLFVGAILAFVVVLSLADIH